MEVGRQEVQDLSYSTRTMARDWLWTLLPRVKCMEKDEAVNQSNTRNVLRQGRTQLVPFSLSQIVIIMSPVSTVLTSN